MQAALKLFEQSGLTESAAELRVTLEQAAARYAIYGCPDGPTLIEGYHTRNRELLYGCPNIDAVRGGSSLPPIGTSGEDL